MVARHDDGNRGNSLISFKSAHKIQPVIDQASFHSEIQELQERIRQTGE
jgi:hypothetical protein